MVRLCIFIYTLVLQHLLRSCKNTKQLIVASKEVDIKVVIDNKTMVTKVFKVRTAGRVMVITTCIATEVGDIAEVAEVAVIMADIKLQFKGLQFLHLFAMASLKLLITVKAKFLYYIF